MQTDKLKDWLERTFWTFLNTFLGLVTLDAVPHVDLSLLHKLEGAAFSAVYTTLKVLAAQHVGDNQDGAAIPGGIRKA